MSGHYNLTLFLPGDLPSSYRTLTDAVTAALHPYDLNAGQEERITLSREALIEQGRATIALYADTVYAAYRSDPLAFYDTHRDDLKHVNYVAGYGERLTWTDQQVWEHQIKIGGYTSDDLNDHGDAIELINPHGKWDFYTLGGRYSGRLRLKDHGARRYPTTFEILEIEGKKTGITDITRLGNLEPVPHSYAVLDATHTDRPPQDRWTEHQPATRSDYATYGEYRDADRTAEENWKYAFPALVNGFPLNTWVVNIDAHR